MKRPILWITIALIVVFGAHHVCAEDTQPQTRAAPDVKVTIACPKNEVVAGENMEFSVTVQNTSDKTLNVAPLQPFAFLTLYVETGGKVVPPNVKATVIFLPDIKLQPGQKATYIVDVCTWFPLGFYAGMFEVSASYLPDRNDRSIVLRSNVVKVEAKARTPEQEKEYQDFVEVLRSAGTEAVDKCKQFLKQHSKSIFEPRVRLEYAARLDLMKNLADIEEVLGEAYERSSPTRPERHFARDIRARSLQENEKIKEAISVLQDVDEPWAKEKVRMLQRRVKPDNSGPPPTDAGHGAEGSEQKSTGSTRSDAKPDQDPNSKIGPVHVD